MWVCIKIRDTYIHSHFYRCENGDNPLKLGFCSPKLANKPIPVIMKINTIMAQLVHKLLNTI